MTRDLSYYFEKDYESVFNAFYRAATEKFGRDCKTEEGKILSFGLNFSFRYNMNGGALRVFFMRCGTGTAVNLHYIIAQLMGARYGAHAKAILAEVESRLGARAVEKEIPLDKFQNYQHSNVSTQPSATVDGRKTCPKCQTSLPADARFCVSCGTALLTAKFCSACGKPVKDSAKFCANCGTKL